LVWPLLVEWVEMLFCLSCCQTIDEPKALIPVQVPDLVDAGFTFLSNTFQREMALAALSLF
jgi:hypothetical protein